MTVHDLASRQPAAPKTPRPSPGPPGGRSRLRLAAAAVLIALSAAAIGGWFALRPTSVELGQVTRGPAVEAVYASGVVEYVRQARIAPVVTAPIRQVLVIEGQTVRAGQRLALLDDGPQLGTVLQLEAQAAQARLAASRQARLYEAGFGARAAHEDARQHSAAAEAAARSARARLADYRLTAPFSGQVLRREAEPGDLARVGTPLFVVADPVALRITADIDERDVGRLQVDQEAVVRADAYPGQIFAARVAEITPQGDASGRVFRARLAIDPNSPLRPGMTVEANLVTARRDRALLAPASAVRDGSVWIIEDGRARRRPVVVGVQGAERTEILEGVSERQSLILDPPVNLKDGSRVTAKVAPA